MALGVTINGNAVTALAGSLRPSWRLGGRGQCSISFVTPSTTPVCGAELVIFMGASRIWAGTMERVTKRLADNPVAATLAYDVTAVSMEQRLDMRLIVPPASDAEPSSTYVALSGTVNTSGTAVTRTAGDRFDKNLKGCKVVINAVTYTVASVTDTGALVLTATAGTQSGVAFAFTPTSGNIFRSLISLYGLDENITLGDIEDGDDTTKRVYEYMPVSEALAELAEFADKVWYVNADGEACYHSAVYIPAAQDIGILGSGVTEGLHMEWVIESTREDLTNARWERVSFNAYAPNNAVLSGDGSLRAFWTDHPVALIQDPILEQPADTFRDVTIGVRGSDTGKDFYYSYAERKITQDSSASLTVSATTNAEPVEVTFTAAHGLATGHWVEFSGVGAGVNGGWRVNVTAADKVELVDSTAPGSTYSSGSAVANATLASGDVLRFTYRRVGGDVANYEDGSSISTRATAENNSGRYETFGESTEIDSDTAALAMATAVVNDRKDLISRVRVRILEDGYAVGQTVGIANTILGISADYLIEGMSAAEHVDGSTLEYTLECINANRTRDARALFNALRLGRSSGGASVVSVSGGSAVNNPSSTVVGAETPYDVTYAATVTIDCANGQNQFLTLTGNVTLNAPSNATGKRLTLYIVQDGTGGWTVSFNAAWKIPTSFEIDTTANTYSVIDIRFNGAGTARLASHPDTGLPI